MTTDDIQSTLRHYAITAASMQRHVAAFNHLRTLPQEMRAAVERMEPVLAEIENRRRIARALAARPKRTTREDETVRWKTYPPDPNFGLRLGRFAEDA